mgnify:FL=1
MGLLGPIALPVHAGSGLDAPLRWSLSLSSLQARTASPVATPTPTPTATALAAAIADPTAQASTGAASGQAPSATPLPQLLQRADHAASNRAADAGVQAAQAQHQQTWANAWMPRLDASASSSRQQQSYNGLESHTPASVVSLTATLPLWRAADRATAQAQEALAEQAFWQARGQHAAVARELSLAYVAGAEAAEQKRLAEAQLALLETQLQVNDKRLRAGVGTVLDQLETRTRVAQTRASIRELAMRARSQQLSIERLSGQPVQLPTGLSPLGAGTAGTQEARPGTLPSLDEALQQATQRNPQLQGSRADVAAAIATTRARGAESWQPTLDASASTSHTRQTQRFEGVSEPQRIRTQAIGVQLNWPLFTGGYQQGRSREAAALLSRSQARQDDAQSLVQSGLQDAYQSLAQAQAMIAAQHEVERTAMATHEALHKAFVAGTRTNIDLLNAQQQIYAARQALVSARVTALTAHIQALALLDQLDAAHVAPLVAQFDPRATATPP